MVNDRVKRAETRSAKAAEQVFSTHELMPSVCLQSRVLPETFLPFRCKRLNLGAVGYDEKEKEKDVRPQDFEAKTELRHSAFS